MKNLLLIALLSLLTLDLAPVRADERGRLKVVAFGDSIMSGFVGLGRNGLIPGGGLAERFARKIAQQTGRRARVSNHAIPGLTTPKISATLRLHPFSLRTADYILLNGGGNDFLNMRGKQDLCDVNAYARPQQEMRASWKASLEEVAVDKKDGAQIMSLGIYFPRLTQYKKAACPKIKGKTVFDVFLPQLLATNHMICRMTAEHGGKCADLLSDFNCPDSLRDRCRWKSSDTLQSYSSRVLKIADQLMDPAQQSLMQGDLLHPNQAGHELIAKILSSF